MSNTEENSIVTGKIRLIAEKAGVILDKEQLNIGGERELLSPNKHVLSGVYTATDRKAILKCASHEAGVAEITEEHRIMQALKNLPFSQEELIAPNETFFGTIENYTVSVTDFIDQPKVFTDYSIEEQFFMAIHLLESQETFHATTREHQNWIRGLFTPHTPNFYIDDFRRMSKNIESLWPNARATLASGQDYLQENKMLLEAFDRYLIHSDLVPHNFRIQNRQLYLLDFVSFRLGNKYESWARFINFMEVHSPDLVAPLLTYVGTDRGSSEYTALKLMRTYKACFLLNYYAESYKKTNGDLHKLTEARLLLWTEILNHILTETPVDHTLLKTYYDTRSQLRPEAEKARQRQFTWVR